MLGSLQERKGYAIQAEDGPIGSVRDFFFDDVSWVVRYLILDTRGFLGPEVLIAPGSTRGVDDRRKLISVGLTREKVKNSPPINTAEPVSRQYQRMHLDYYGLPTWWGAGAASGVVPAAVGALPPPVPEPISERDGDPHLRSSGEVKGYSIGASDGRLGKIKDYLVDPDWHIRYLVVETSKWWIGRVVLLSPVWAREIDWARRLVHVELSRQVVRTSPEWHPGEPIPREYEERLHEHYGRPPYWEPNPK